jgi:serine/threonine-protein phosphatase 2A regulatory subunit A
LGSKEISDVLVPMILKLANNEQNFTFRVSAINLMYTVYPRAGDLKLKIREKFYELGNEETPMVKKAVAKNIGEFAKNMSKENFVYELIPLFRKLSADE